MFQFVHPDPITTLILESYDAKQPLLYVPIRYVRTVPKSYSAEWVQVQLDSMTLTFVDKKSPLLGSRVKIVRHHGGAQISVPRPWLRNRGARPGDRLECYELVSGQLLVTLVRS